MRGKMKKSTAHNNRYRLAAALLFLAVCLAACAQDGGMPAQETEYTVEADMPQGVGGKEEPNDAAEADAAEAGISQEDGMREVSDGTAEADAAEAGTLPGDGTQEAPDSTGGADETQAGMPQEEGGQEAPDSADEADETEAGISPGDGAQESPDEAEQDGAAAGTAPKAGAATPYGEHGALSVRGAGLCDASGAPYQLRGVSTHGLSWFPQYANQDAFRTMRDVWGINVVRLAMYTYENGGYCVGDDHNRAYLKGLVYDSVDAATELGLYVIVDWHVLNDRDPNLYIDQAIAFFEETAKRYASYGNVIYEICNEPNGGVSWPVIKAYAERVIPVIKAQDADAVIIVGTPTWSQDVDQAAADPITGYSGIMYALHFYADTHRDSLRQKMVSAIEGGLPVFVSEYGICDASGNGAINREQADLWVDAMDRYGVSYCIWSLSNKAETASLLKPSTSATSGWGYEELSDCGKWFVDMMGAEHTAPVQNRDGQGTEQNSGNRGAEQDSGSTDSSGQGNTGAAAQDGGAGLTTDAKEQGALQASLKLTNSWESGGKHYYQYSLELSNNSGARISGWSCEIAFDGSFSVSQSWCGTFTADGGRLTITPESYNAQIEAGAVQGDIGFILEAASPVAATELLCR